MKKGGKKDKKKVEKKLKKYIFEKKAEEKKETGEEKSLEEEIFEIEEEIDNSGFGQFLQPLVLGKTFPVLDRIAVVESADLEQQLANARISRDDKEENQMSYGGKKVDYGAAAGNERENRIKYETEAPNYNAIGREKKDEDKNRLTNHEIKSEWNEKDKKEKWYT
ncbi:MAG: hypothetical protein AABY03_00010 [Nanoarchaeota archaeon]